MYSSESRKLNGLGTIFENGHKNYHKVFCRAYADMKPQDLIARKETL